MSFPFVLLYIFLCVFLLFSPSLYFAFIIRSCPPSSLFFTAAVVRERIDDVTAAVTYTTSAAIHTYLLLSSPTKRI